MNPSLPFYRGRFALLWHELPASVETDLENCCKKPGSIQCQLGEDAGPRPGEPSYDSHSHWDLMLELDDGQLLTWRLPRLPLAELLQVGHEFIGCRLPNHRPMYLDYEGPVSNNRGWVTRIASGEYRVVMLGKAADSDSGEDQHSTVSSSFDSGFNPMPSELTEVRENLRLSLQGQYDFRCMLIVQLTPVETNVWIKVCG